MTAPNQPATHPLVLALLHLTRQITAARVRPVNPLEKWPAPAELLHMADEELSADMTLRRREGGKP